MSTKKIGRFIAEKRREKNYTQAQLAEMLGVTSKTISRWENGNYMPDLSMLIPLCNILEIELEELLNGENNIEGRSRKELEQEYLENQKRQRKLILFETVASYIFLGIVILISFGTIIISYNSPKPVEFLGGFKVERMHMIWAALISGPLAIFYFALAGYEIFAEKRLKKMTGIATGKITGLVCSHLFRNDTYGEVSGGALIGWGVSQGEQTWSGISAIKKRIPPWFPCVKYEVDGKEIEKITGEGVWKDIWEVGQTVMVLYDPKKPSICMLEDDPSYRYRRNVFLILAGVLTLLCIATSMIAIKM